MKTFIIAGIVGIILVAGGILMYQQQATAPLSGGTTLRTTDQAVEVTRPDIEAQGNTFGVMSPEEKAAAEAAAQASSSTSTLADTEATPAAEVSAAETTEPEYPDDLVTSQTLDIQQGLSQTVDYGLQDQMYSW